MGDDKWTKKALIDDSIVVALLLRLKQHNSSPPLRWGHRQLRSKPPSSREQRQPSTTRCSPTTPLSWSAASLSDGCDYSAARSKGTCTYEAGTSTSKKLRKKKTFTELREEESYLMNERVHLEKELASVHVTLNEQRYRGDNLKRIKLDFQEPMPTMFFQCRQTKASLDSQNNLILPRQARYNDPESSSSCKLPKDNESRERCFILPDLNMTPAEEAGCESLFQEA